MRTWEQSIYLSICAYTEEVYPMILAFTTSTTTTITLVVGVVIIFGVAMIFFYCLDNSNLISYAYISYFNWIKIS